MPRASKNSVASIGEFALIDRIRRLVPTGGRGVALGIGDDAAVLTFPGPVVATCDIQVEGVHFTWDLAGPEDVGWRAVAVSLSDIAAMGGTPRFLLISLALPPNTPVETVEGIYRGVAEISASYAVVVAGGNLSSTSGPLVIDVTALGDGERTLTRGGARPGDQVWVTGTVGKAMAGRFLAMHPRIEVPERDALIAAYRRPSPRVEAGKVLGRVPAISAMIDTSDGMASDLLHLAEASKVGVQLEVDRLPVTPGLVHAAREAGGDPNAWTLAGGEDYELLFTAAREFELQAANLVARLEVALTRIGEILPEPEGRWVVDRGGHRRELSARGWDHFQPRR